MPNDSNAKLEVQDIKGQAPAIHPKDLELQEYMQKLASTLQEPQKTVVQLYSRHLFRRDGLALYSLGLSKDQIRTDEDRASITKLFQSAIQHINKLKISLSPKEIQDTYDKYGVVQLRPIASKTLVAACGNCNDSIYHKHIDSDTIDCRLTQNPTIVGYYGDTNMVGAFAGHRYQYIIDEGPLGILSGGRAFSSESALLTDQLLDQQNGVVIAQVAYNICLTMKDENNEVMQGYLQKGLPVHTHLRSETNPKSQKRYDENTAIYEKAASSPAPANKPYKHSHHFLSEFKNNNNAALVNNVVTEIEKTGYGYFNAHPITMFFKNKKALPQELVCPYSQCTEVYNYDSSKENCPSSM